ncbi:1,4-dihydroxy-2-naphthoate polyprenyltransferase [Gordonia sp. X0973]|uniref:1,4-dihydroxy-2-naphthoate polyprenyltransferase n=1 Tax=Gordonia sp. X0973 TaxID=2742602 RepID=UPI000F5223BB|nr:1,4-dihydroxy-2-naphthoate polyprenyltransferase [Gordonia sp. X0973]QKT08388.1 1,4-dihydroxy-2-naphthoate polyprenyltransferase [Gordonia sp. X0973]
MATVSQWINGARPRTLPNALAPVIAGIGAAYHVNRHPDWVHVLAAFVVAIALIIGVNYANDYSDGVRGTDDDRVGPARLVGSGTASPKSVRTAAVFAFAVAAVVGAWLSLNTHWWLILVGAACIAAAWFYTGGSRPYGYAGFGEVAVFVFFGLVAVCGTQLVVGGKIDLIGVLIAVAVGSFSAAVLVTNNLRDIDTDEVAGKKTLAVRLGDYSTRYLYAFLITVPFVITVLLAFHHPWALVGLFLAPFANGVGRTVVGGANGPALVKTLGHTGLIMFGWALVTALAFIWGLDGGPHAEIL